MKNFFRATKSRIEQIINPKKESYYYKRPHIQQFDGLVVPTTYSVDLPFHYVDRVIIDFRYETASESFVLFGVDAALTDGIQIKYNNTILFDMKSTADLGEFSYDIADLEDDAATKFHTIHSRYSFNKFAPEGLRVLHASDVLQLIIQEDLSGGGNDSLTFTFEGWYQ